MVHSHSCMAIDPRQGPEAAGLRKALAEPKAKVVRLVLKENMEPLHKYDVCLVFRLTEDVLGTYAWLGARLLNRRHYP